MSRSQDADKTQRLNEIVRKSRREVRQSALATLIIVAIMLFLVVFIAGSFKILSPDDVDVQENSILVGIKAGLENVFKIFPSHQGNTIAGTLAAISIAQTVSSRSLFREVKHLPQTSNTTDGTLAADVEKAAQLQHVFSIAVLFSLFLTSTTALFAWVMLQKQCYSAGAVGALLGAFLFFESMQLMLNKREIDEFREELSEDKKAKYNRLYRNATNARRSTWIWYAIILALVAGPAIYTVSTGELALAGKLVGINCAVWAVAISLCLLLSRDISEFNQGQRAISRVISFFIVLCFGIISMLATLEAIANERAELRLTDTIQLVSCLFISVMMLLRAWGETAWSVFRSFGIQYANLIQDSNTNGELQKSASYWISHRQSVRFWITLAAFGILVFAPIIIFLIIANSKQAVLTGVLALVSIIMTLTARWSTPPDRIWLFSSSIFLVWLTFNKSIENDILTSQVGQIYFSVFLMLAILASWDRGRYFPPTRPLLSVFDQGVAQQAVRMSDVLDNCVGSSNLKQLEGGKPVPSN